LHHIYDYSAIFTDISRVIKNGGVLYTDWDPNKVDVFYIKLRPLTFSITAIVRTLAGSVHRKMIDEEEYEREKLDDQDCDVRKLAEYHNMGIATERGIDFDLMKKILSQDGFINIEPHYHWHGYSLKQIVEGPNRMPEKLLLNTISKFNKGIDRYLENIQITAIKK
jgi:hypothetical protein